MTPAVAEPTPFVGREAELRRLRGAIAAVADGDGSTIRVVGVAGLGKSRLLHEAFAGCPVPVRRGHVDPAERGRPFAALTRALEIDVPDLRGTTVGGVLGSDPTWVAIDAIVDEVDRRTASGPLVLVLEDLHWADPGTWQTVAVLARRATDAPLLLVLTHRPMVGDGPSPVPVDDIGTSMALAPLDPDAAIEVATSVLGRDVTDDDRVHVARTGGNPFFVAEVARWRRDGDPAGDADRTGDGDVDVPALVRRVVSRQVDELPATTVAVLRALALLGRRASVADLAAHTSQPADLVAVGVEAATQVGLVDDEADGIAFRHDLLRDAILAATPPSVAAAHLALAADKPLVDPWAAKHLAERTEPGDHRAAAVIARAARAAGVAPDAAAELLAHVLRIGPHPDEPIGAVEVDYLVALLRAGDAGVVDEARRLAASLPTPTAEHPAVVELQRLRARVHFSRSEAVESVALLRELETIEGVVGQRARSDRCFVEVVATSRVEAAAEAAEHRLACDDPLARANAELAVSIDATRTGRFAEGIDAAAAAVAQVAVDPNVSADLHPEIILANALLYAERFEEATEALLHAEAAARRAGVVWPRPHHLAFRAGDALRRGDFDACQAAAREAIGWSDDSAQRITATWPHVFNALAAIHVGDVEDGERSLAAAQADLAAGRLQGAEAVPWVQALLAELRGDRAEAAELLVPLAQLADAIGLRMRVPMIAPEAARMAWLADRHDDVAALHELLTGYDDFAVEEADAGLARCRAFHLGDHSAAVAAAEIYEGLGSRSQAGIAWCEAVLIAARTEPDAAVRIYDQRAQPLLLELGAHGVLARTRSSVPVRVGRRLGRRPERPDFGIESLTPAERRIVDLVGSGASNGEIAEQLQVSRRTVESHLSRIYRKVDVRSRVKLAALATAS